MLIVLTLDKIHTNTHSHTLNHPEGERRRRRRGGRKAVKVHVGDKVTASFSLIIRVSKRKSKNNEKERCV